MTLKRKMKVDNPEEIEVLDEEMPKKETKEKKGVMATIFLIISIILLLLSIGTFGYLYINNQKLEKDINESKENVKKVEEKINADEKEITEKEDEYEKLKEQVKDSLEELNIWEEIKEELNKSLQ